MNYFVLEISEDGDVYLKEQTGEEILTDLKNGEMNIEDVASEVTETDLMEAPKRIYIFRGGLVVPKVKKVVEEYEI